ncbi:DUF1289 domain-containing protein [Skermanella mucosa]|uniref:DUF1289 domain-containing protein n=1 Tax=Skermanella mucosa TaxID=1789672 RepID=UPI00192B41C9|nr:DUF1289 domain-containing protein [Skermanella mucosa]UEM21421.1 DUF1289 domain-containing protein [Skermanella mucosa]
MAKLKTRNPCTDVCKYDSDKVCKGCGRTRTEVKAWKSFSDEEKDAINRRVRETHLKGKDKKK